LQQASCGRQVCATNKKERRQDAGGTKEKRPDRVGAQWSTEILYHNGNAGQIKKLGENFGVCRVGLDRTMWSL
jgi:hypothetical protein